MYYQVRNFSFNSCNNNYYYVFYRVSTLLRFSKGPFQMPKFLEDAIFYIYPIGPLFGMLEIPYLSPVRHTVI